MMISRGSKYDSFLLVCRRLLDYAFIVLSSLMGLIGDRRWPLLAVIMVMIMIGQGTECSQLNAGEHTRNIYAFVSDIAFKNCVP